VNACAKSNNMEIKGDSLRLIFRVCAYFARMQMRAEPQASRWTMAKAQRKGERHSVECGHAHHQHPPIGELHPLPIPSAPWDTISVDFIVKLPQSAGHDSIMVVIDSVTKRAHFVSTVTTISAARAAHLFSSTMCETSRSPSESRLW